ncbi:MAG TPA: hypothetical protein VGH20_19010, partial [Myxococcales bacterium]
AVELVLENLPQALEDAFRARGAQALKRDRGTVLTFGDEATAREALRAAVEASAVVVSLTPHRRTLEELFVARARGTATTS